MRDKLRYLALTDQKLAEGMSDFRINLSTVKKDRSITVADNGIGMNKEDLIENLGTIARPARPNSWKACLVTRKKTPLIGQFGVGFYASFSVAEKVEVLSRKAGEDQGWLWTSDGAGTFTIAEADKEVPGTAITVFLKKEDKDYIEDARIRNIVRTYSIIFRCLSCLQQRRGRPTKHRFRHLDASEKRHHRRTIQGILSSCRTGV